MKTVYAAGWEGTAFAFVNWLADGGLFVISVLVLSIAASAIIATVTTR